jgi:hypothetical protein
MWLLKIGPGKTKKILEKSLKSHGIFSQKRCMNPAGGKTKKTTHVQYGL